MDRSQPEVDDPVRFSLVQGGPFFQMLLRSGLVGPSMDLLARRIVAIVALAWLPLLVLTLVSGSALAGPGVSFIHDLGAQARLLLAIPVLIAAEVIVHRRMGVTVRQFLDRGIIAPADQAHFEAVAASAIRLRNSPLAELLLLAFAVSGGYLLGARYVSTDVASWFAAVSGDQTRFTPAGYWYIFVSMTIFRFLLFRWYFRLFIWYRFLWQVSRHVPLQLNALHPDRTGGLAFLSGSAFALQPLLVAHTIVLSGVLGSRIWHEGATLPQFKMEIIVWLVFLILLVVTPLFFFIVQLSTAKRAGACEYGIVGSRYVADFRRKWIEGHADKDEALIGSADVQSLADLANSYEVVQEMRVVPITRAAVIRLVTMTTLPLAPLLLTMIPLEELVDRVLGALL